MHLMAARRTHEEEQLFCVAADLLREAPSRGKEVTSQLLRPGQIPGVFLKEAGCGEKPPGLCAATAIVWGEK